MTFSSWFKNNFSVFFYMQRQVRKGRWLRRILRTILTLLILFIIACFIFDHYYQFRKSDKELKQFYSGNHIPATIGYYETHGRKLRYVSVGDEETKGTLVFLHGSPGSISFYSGRFRDKEILDKFHIYAVDRPGYGYSGFGHPEPSIQKQSEMVRVAIDSLHHAKHPVIIVGSSYGAAIACRLAMDHPELVDGLVLTGPAIGPGLEKYFWFTNIIESPLIRWFIPRMFRSANTEKVYHKKELEKMLPYWKNIRIPVAYLQGENDEIVDTVNANFARQHLLNVPYLDIQFVKERGHRLARFEWPRFKEEILKVYERIEK
jgi:pimeloyl-ACP methyl ester carboxylesterase